MPGKVDVSIGKPLGLPVDGKTKLEDEYGNYIKQLSVSNNINSIQTNNENSVEQPAIVSNNIDPEKQSNENNAEQVVIASNNNVTTQNNINNQDSIKEEFSKAAENAIAALKELEEGVRLLSDGFIKKLDGANVVTLNSAASNSPIVNNDTPETPVVDSVAPPIIVPSPESLQSTNDNTMKMVV